MKFNEKELKIASIRKSVNYEQLAEVLKISKSAFYAKIKKGEFKLSEIYIMSSILKLEMKDIEHIFFANWLALRNIKRK